MIDRTNYMFGIPTIWLFVLISVSFPNQMMVAFQEDPEQYRQAKSLATDKFFDASASVEERLNAAKQLGYPDRGTMDRLLQLGQDRNAEDLIRWEALRRYPWTPEWAKTVIGILNETDDGGEKLNAELVKDLSRRTVSLVGVELRQDIQRTFRKLLDDPRPSVRTNAFFALVSTQDHVATTKLVEGLKNGGQESPIALRDAIELVDVAGATGHFQVLRPYLKHENSDVQAEAVRVLSADPDSRLTIAELIAKKETDDRVRVQGLRGMARYDENFANYSIPLIQNIEETDTIREAAINAMAGRLNYKKTDDSVQVDFAEAIEKFVNEKGQQLNNVPAGLRSKKLLENLKKNCPPIRKHYESRN